MFKKLCLLAALTTMFFAPTVNAFGIHPFSPQTILWYQYNAPGAEENKVWIGGAQGIDQGAHDDCWFEAAVASCARFQPGCRLLADMIDYAPDGGYRVTFLDQPDNHYRVTEGDIQKYHVKDNARWADILEAGLIKRFPMLQNGEAGNAEIGAMYGSQRSLGLEILTGHEPSILYTHDTPASVLADTIERNMRLHIPMTAGTKEKYAPPVVMVTGHAYTLLSYDRGNDTVMLRNPWGKNSSPKFPDLPAAGETKGGVHDIGGGVITMNMAHFIKYYRNMSYSRIHHL